MKYSPVYEDLIGCSTPEEVFEYLQETLIPSVTRWSYFINWEKALGNTREIDEAIHALNALVDHPDPEEGLRDILNEKPTVVKALPALIADRDQEFQILTNFEEGNIQHRHFDMTVGEGLSDEDVDDAVYFARKSGILALFEDDRISSVEDYVFGVEVGIDTNARKNRGGKQMENALLEILGPICDRHGYDLMEQATAKKLDRQWGIDLTVDQTRRRVDFAINTGEKLYLIEANFYNSGGSKLKSTAGEYQTLQDIFKEDGHEFVWITDGFGWKTTFASLRETFEANDYTLNLQMVSDGILRAILSGDI